MTLSLGRREALASLLGLGAVTLLGRSAQATTAVALTLDELVQRSLRIAVATPEATSSRWEAIGKGRRIVSYTRIVLDEELVGAGEGSCLVRTLGGAVGEQGQLVHGEAQLRAGEPCLVFLRPRAEGAHVVTARAQGHYPLLPDAGGVLRVRPSPLLPELVAADASAVRRLSGRPWGEARRMLREAAVRQHR